MIRSIQRAFAHGPTRTEESITLAEWSPSADIGENDKEFVVKTETAAFNQRRAQGRRRRSKARSPTAWSGPAAALNAALRCQMKPTRRRLPRNTRRAS